MAADETEEEVKSLIYNAIEFHLVGLKENGDPIPEPSCSVEFIMPGYHEVANSYQDFYTCSTQLNSRKMT